MTVTPPDILAVRDELDRVMSNHDISQQSSKLVGGVRIALMNGYDRLEEGNISAAEDCIIMASRITDASFKHTWQNETAKDELKAKFQPELETLEQKFDDAKVVA